MEHQSWMIEADHVFGPLNEEDDDDLKNHWNNLNDALNTKLKGTVNVPDYGEVKNDGSILLFCHQLLGDAYFPLYRGKQGLEIDTDDEQRNKAEEILGYDIEPNGDTPFMKRITADTIRDAIRIFEQEYRAFLEALWGDTAQYGSRMYFVEILEIHFEDEDQLHCDIQMGT